MTDKQMNKQTETQTDSQNDIQADEAVKLNRLNATLADGSPVHPDMGEAVFTGEIITMTDEEVKARNRRNVFMGFGIIAFMFLIYFAFMLRAIDNIEKNRGNILGTSIEGTAETGGQKPTPKDQ